MTSLIVIILAVLFVWLLMQAQKSQRRIHKSKQRMMKKIRERER